QAKASAQPVKSAETGDGMLVVTRPNAADGGSPINIYVDDFKVGSIMGGQKQTYPLSPGSHEVYFHYGSKSNVYTLDVVPGKQIVFEVKFKWLFGTDVVVNQLSS
ncbi:MAG: hypothetical protein KC547_15170, partial [Anaerolineae bacterium]|nr:hypothetical protein [Anaerolineae bacterium]